MQDLEGLEIILPFNSTRAHVQSIALDDPISRKREDRGFWNDSAIDVRKNAKSRFIFISKFILNF